MAFKRQKWCLERHKRHLSLMKWTPGEDLPMPDEGILPTLRRLHFVLAPNRATLLPKERDNCLCERSTIHVFPSPDDRIPPKSENKITKNKSQNTPNGKAIDFNSELPPKCHEKSTRLKLY